MSSEHDNAAVVRRVLELLSDRRADEALKLVSDDLVLQMPLRHDGGPPELRGEGARRFIGSIPKLFSRMNFTEITVHGATPGGVIAAEYASDGQTSAGEPYRNRYAGFFEVRDGKITRWREYFDPMVIKAAFKL